MPIAGKFRILGEKPVPGTSVRLYECSLESAWLPGQTADAGFSSGPGASSQEDGKPGLRAENMIACC